MDSFTRYVKLRTWLERRYTRDGMLLLSQDGKPTRYVILESMAFSQYILGESYKSRSKR